MTQETTTSTPQDFRARQIAKQMAALSRLPTEKLIAQIDEARALGLLPPLKTAASDARPPSPKEVLAHLKANNHPGSVFRVVLETYHGLQIVAFKNRYTQGFGVLVVNSKNPSGWAIGGLHKTAERGRLRQRA